MGRGWVDRVLDRGYVRNNVHSKKKISSFNNLEYTVWIIIIYFVILFSFSFFFFLLHNLNSDIGEYKSILSEEYDIKRINSLNFMLKHLLSYSVSYIVLNNNFDL